MEIESGRNNLRLDPRQISRDPCFVIEIEKKTRVCKWAKVNKAYHAKQYHLPEISPTGNSYCIQYMAWVDTH